MDGGADRNGSVDAGRTFPHRFFAAVVSAWSAFCLTGCMIVQVGVTNPVPSLTTVAVAPFFNQSEERAVDGRRFAIAYASELQKIPGLEVIPVGIVETRMRELGLQQLSSPSDALKLAELLNADAVVIGSVTEYQPYYPPRIGMSVAWYSPYHHRFTPGIPTNPRAKRQLVDAVKDAHGLGLRRNVRRTASSLSQLADRFFLEDSNRQVDGIDENRIWEPTVPRNELRSKQILPPQRKSKADNGGGRIPLLVPQQSPGNPQKTPGTTKHRSSTGASVIRGQSPSASQNGRQNLTSDAFEPLQDNLIAPPRLQRPHALNTQMNWLNAEHGSGEVELPNFPVRRADSPPSTQTAPPLGRDHFGIRREPQSSHIAQTRFSLPAVTIRKILQNPQKYGVTQRPSVPKKAPGSQKQGTLQSPRRLPVEQTPLKLPLQLPLQLPLKLPLKLPLQFSPLMSYTRIFDAADADLVALWRDHLELSGDQRSGDWVTRLYWSENFLRFSARQMIVEMFQLHGGEAKRRIILKLRKYR